MVRVTFLLSMIVLIAMAGCTPLPVSLKIDTPTSPCVLAPAAKVILSLSARNLPEQAAIRWSVTQGEIQPDPAKPLAAQLIPPTVPGKITIRVDASHNGSSWSALADCSVGAEEMPSPSPTNTPTLAEPVTATPTITSTLTALPPEAALQNLIDQESQAILTQNLRIIKAIFHPEALRVDAASGATENAIQWYERNFDTKNADRYEFLSSIHLNYQFDIRGSAATVTNDSCGSFVKSGVKSKYTSIQSDRWTFEQDGQGRWWIKEFAFNLPFTGSQLIFAFEEARSDCLPWEVRYVDGIPQGQPPGVVQDQVRKGVLQFTFDTAANPDHRGQVVAYGIPFAGVASAFVYVPEDITASLEAGFFAQDYDHAPWNYHPPTHYVRLIPGKWTEVTWEISTQGWPNPLHLLGIEIRPGGEPYAGYVLIDLITIKIR
jgi:hypothetical protein